MDCCAAVQRIGAITRPKVARMKMGSMRLSRGSAPFLAASAALFLNSQEDQLTVCTANKKSQYCTADDDLLNGSDLSAGGGFFIKFDSRTRNPKFVVQRNVRLSKVR